MGEMGKASKSSVKVPSFVFLLVFLVLVVSLVAILAAIYLFDFNVAMAGYLLIFGASGMAISTYVLVQIRRRVSRLKIEVPQIQTTIECKKCGVKKVREFQRGDYVFKEGEACEKCNDKTLITAIYREVKDKGK